MEIPSMRCGLKGNILSIRDCLLITIFLLDKLSKVFPFLLEIRKNALSFTCYWKYVSHLLKNYNTLC